MFLKNEKQYQTFGRQTLRFDNCTKLKKARVGLSDAGFFIFPTFLSHYNQGLKKFFDVFLNQQAAKI